MEQPWEITYSSHSNNVFKVTVIQIGSPPRSERKPRAASLVLLPQVLLSLYSGCSSVHRGMDIMESFREDLRTHPMSAHKKKKGGSTQTLH